MWTYLIRFDQERVIAIRDGDTSDQGYFLPFVHMNDPEILNGIHESRRAVYLIARDELIELGLIPDAWE